jgi:hypothetical protein
MAIVSLKEVPVTYLNQNGNGVKVTESNESKGRTFTQQYTLWFKDPSGLSVGDIISVSGFLSAKLGKPWTDREGVERQSVELSINEPRLDGQQASRPDEEPPADVRPAPEEEPF